MFPSKTKTNDESSDEYDSEDEKKNKKSGKKEEQAVEVDDLLDLGNKKAEESE